MESVCPGGSAGFILFSRGQPERLYSARLDGRPRGFDCNSCLYYRQRPYPDIPAVAAGVRAFGKGDDIRIDICNNTRFYRLDSIGADRWSTGNGSLAFADAGNRGFYGDEFHRFDHLYIAFGREERNAFCRARANYCRNAWFIFVGDGQIFLGGIKMLRYLENVVTLQLDTETCNGCGMCVNVCPHGVFNVQDRKAAIVDKEACMECGACALNCPVNAIKVQSGVGCATAIIMGAIGKKSECSGSCGGSPAANAANKSGSCGATK